MVVFQHLEHWIYALKVTLVPSLSLLFKFQSFSYDVINPVILWTADLDGVKLFAWASTPSWTVFDCLIQILFLCLREYCLKWTFWFNSKFYIFWINITTLGNTGCCWLTLKLSWCFKLIWIICTLCIRTGMDIMGVALIKLQQNRIVFQTNKPPFTPKFPNGVRCLQTFYHFSGLCFLMPATLCWLFYCWWPGSCVYLSGCGIIHG